MLMTDAEIKSAMAAGDITIEHFEKERLEAASYDARVGNSVLLGGRDVEIDMRSDRTVTIEPGDFVLILTRERFALAPDIVGHLGLRSYLGRKGLVLLAGLQIDPGFDGHLVIGGFNAAPRRLHLDFEEHFVTVEFHRLSRTVEQPYATHEELRKGVIPRLDKEYLRGLEKQSLSDVANEMRVLTSNVGMLTKDVGALEKNVARLWPVVMGTLAVATATLISLTGALIGWLVTNWPT